MVALFRFFVLIIFNLCFRFWLCLLAFLLFSGRLGNLRWLGAWLIIAQRVLHLFHINVVYLQLSGVILVVLLHSCIDSIQVNVVPRGRDWRSLASYETI